MNLPMHYFDYRNDALACEEVPLEAIADAVGTPTYVYSQRTLRRHVSVFDAAFRDVSHQVCYAVKANSNLTLLGRFLEWGIGFEVVSGGELRRVFEAGAGGHQVIFSGVGKTREEIVQALEAQILFFSVESASELELIAEVARSRNVRAPVVLRTNPDVDPRTHPYISTGLRHHKFGIPLADARALIARAGDLGHLDVVGIGCHIGSQITEIAPFAEALEGVTRLARELVAEGAHLRFLNFGGGLGIAYDRETPPPPDRYAATIIEASRGLDLKVVLEPGRVIVGNAGILLCRVVRLKDQGAKRFVIVDAGMNDLLRPALYNSFHSLKAVRVREGREVVDVVGPVCESADFIAQDREMSVLEAGDLVAVMSAGAYGFSLASNYNSRLRPAEVMVDGDQFGVIRRRETYEDLVRLERGVVVPSPDERVTG
jgi:diaminopimelate decarboxylase